MVKDPCGHDQDVGGIMEVLSLFPLAHLPTPQIPQDLQTHHGDCGEPEITLLNFP